MKQKKSTNSSTATRDNLGAHKRLGTPVYLAFWRQLFYTAVKNRGVFAVNKLSRWVRTSVLRALEPRYVLVVILFVVMPLMALSTVTTPPAEAAINEQLRFQARLLTAGGDLVPDGFYNVRFKILCGGDGLENAAEAVGCGDATDEDDLWTEDWLNSDGNGIRVVNGYLAASLGSINPFGANVDWNLNELWLSIEIGNTSGVCTPFANCGGDGEMDPHIRFNAVPSAINSGQLDGRDSSEFVQLDPGGTSQSVNTANAVIDINQTGAGDLVNLEVSSTQVFGVDASGNVDLAGQLTVGSPSNAGVITLYDSDAGSQSVTFQAGAIGTSYSLTLPTALGSAGQCLSDTDGAGTLGWSGCAGGGGSSEFTDAGTFLYPSDLSGAEDIVIGSTTTAGSDIWLQATGGAIFNNQGAAVSFTVEGDNQADLFTVDGANDRVGIGIATPSTIFQVDGTATFGDATNTNGVLIFENSTNSNYIQVQTQVPTDSPIIYEFADAAAGTYTICSTAGNCPGVDIQIDGVLQSTGLATLDFDSQDFVITESPTDDFDITINDERIEDIIGVALTGGTQTGLTVTYQDGTDDFDLVVDNLEDLAGTLDVASGGTGATSFTAGGVVIAGATFSDTGVLANGELLIGDGAGAPTVTTLTQGTGITITNGAGSITIASTLGTDIVTGEIADDTILEADLDITNVGGAGVDNYVLTYDDATGGFTWVDPATVGTDQDLFETIDAPNGTDPVADSATDTLQFVDGAGIVITGDSVADSITIAASLGTSIDTSEITDDTVLEADLDITNAGGAGVDNYVLTYDDATGGFTWVDPATVGSDTYAAVQIDGVLQSTNAVILDFDGTDFVVTESPADDFDITINDERIEDIIGAALTSGTMTDITVTYQDGTDDFDFVVDTLPNLTGTLDVDSGGTGLTTVTTGAVLFGNGTGAFTNSGVLGNGELLIGDGTGAPTVTTLTQGAGITVTNGAGSITIASTLGTAIDTSEITDDTILEADLDITNAGGAGVDNYVLTYDDATGGFTWVDPSTVGTSQNLFETIDAPNGTDPVADSATDTLQFVDGAGVVITGDSTLDTITIAASLGTSVDTTEIDNDSILEIDLDVTNAGGAGVDNYVLSYDDATGGFTWVDPASFAGTDTFAAIQVDGAGVSTNAVILDFDGTDFAVTESPTDDFDITIQDERIEDIIGNALTAGTLTDITITYQDGTDDFDFTIDTLPNLTGTLDVDSGGTGLTTVTAGAVLFGNGTGAFTNSGVLGNGELLIGDGTGAPTVTTLTQGTGITVTNGAGSITIASTLGAAIDTSEITDDTILEADLDVTNAGGAGVDNWVLTYDDATGGFTWVDPSTYGGSAQNLFETIDTPNGTDPVADSATDTLQFVDGAGIVITGDSSLDSITIAASLGTAIDTSEITDDTILEADLDITNAGGAGVDNYALTYDDATGGFTWVDPTSFAGTDTFAAVQVDGTGVSTNAVILDFDGTDFAVTESPTDDFDITINDERIEDIIGTALTSGTLTDITITYQDGTDDFDFTIDTLPNLTGTLDVDSGGTGLTTVTTGAVLFGNGTGAFTNSGVLGNGELLIGDGTGAPTVTTLTQGTGITVTNGAGSITIASTLGTSVDTTEIDNDSILEIDLDVTNVGGAGVDNYVLSYDDATGGFTWVDPSGLGGAGSNSFETLDAPNGTDPVADSGTDTLTFVDGAGIVITGDSSLDSITIAASLGTAIDTSEITDDTILEADLDITNAGGAGVDNYVLSYDDASGGFTWVNPSGLGAGDTFAAIQVDGTGVSTNAVILDFDGTDFAVTESPTDDFDITIRDERIEDIVGAALTSGTLTDITITYQDASDNFDFTIDTLPNLTGTLDVDSGGTGLTTVTAGSILFGNGTGAFTNSGVLGNGELLIGDGTGAPTVTTLTQGTGITVTNGAGSITIASTLGTSVDSSELVDDSILEADLDVTNVGGAGVDNYILSYDDATGGFTWVDPSAVGTPQNLFETIDAPNGTDPVADSATDTLQFVDGAGIVITGDSSLDSITIAASLGTAIDTSEITDDTILEADLDITNAGGVGVDNYVLSYDDATGGFTWVDPAGFAGSDTFAAIQVDGTGVSTNAVILDFDGTDFAVTESPTDDFDITIRDERIEDIIGTALTSGTLTDITITYQDASDNFDFTIDTLPNLTGTLDVDSGGTGLTTVTTGAILFGNGTGAFTNSGVLGNGELLIGDGTGAPSVTTLTQGTGITVTNGAGSITIASTLGTSVDTGELVDDSILEADLDITNAGGAGVDNYVLTYDDATGGFTWVDPSTVGTPQNLFETIDAPNGTDPVADSATDTLQFVDGAGVVITGDSTLDTITIASTLGTAIDTSEITDDTILEADLDITNAGGAGVDNYVLSYDDATGGFTWVDPAGFAGSDTFAAIQIDGTGVSTNAVILDFDGTDFAITESPTDDFDITIQDERIEDIIGAALTGGTLSDITITYQDGTDDFDFTIDTLPNLTGTLDVDSGGTGLTTVTTGAILFGNGTGAFTNSGVLGNGELLIGDGTGAPAVATLTQGTGITITNGAGSITIASTLGTAIDTSEITDDTILEADLDITNAGGAGVDNYILSYDDATGGFTWVDPASVGTDQNLFETIDTPNGTDPVADSATDTLQFVDGAGIVITGDSTLDSITIAASLGTAIDTSEITDDTIIEADLDITNAGGAGVDNYVLSYDDATGGFTWVDPAGFAGSDTFAAIQVDGTGVSTNAVILDFDGTDFAVTESPTDDFDITIRDERIEDIIGAALTSGTLTDITITYQDGTDNFDFAIDTLPNLTGTLDVDSGGTGLTTVTTGAILFGNGTGAFTNSGVLGNGELLIGDGTGAPTVTTLTQGTGITVTNGAGSITIAATLGVAIDTSEITDDTILEADLDITNTGGAGVDNYILSYDDATGGFTWVDPASVGTDQNLFETFDTPNGTDPVADSATDTLQFVDGAGVVITGDSSLDTITIAASLGTAIDTSEITDDTILEADLDVTNAGGPGVDNYLLSYDDGTGGFTWVDPSSVGPTVTLQSAYGNDADGSNTRIDLTAADDSILFSNPASSGTDSSYVLGVQNLATGSTTASFTTLNVASSGSYNTTASNLTNYGLYVTNTSTESAGANVLTNVGLYVTASGGDTNYAALFNGGNVGINDTSPIALLTVGASDAFQVNSSGAIAAITGYTQASGNFSFNNGTGQFSVNSDDLDITSGGAISGVTGFTQSSGNFSFSGGAGQFIVDSDDLDITSGGAISGVTGFTQSSGNFSFSGGAGQFIVDSDDLDISSGGAITGATGITLASGNFLQSGTGTFGTGTGAVSLNGATTIASTLLVQGATTTIGGNSTAGGLVVSDGAATANYFTIQAEGAIGGNYTVSIPTEISGADFFCLENANNCGGTSFWATDSNVVNLVTDGDTVTIGSNTAGGKLFVDGDADEVQLEVQAVSGQTANIVEVESFDGSSDYFIIDSSGNSTFGNRVTLGAGISSGINAGTDLLVNRGNFSAPTLSDDPTVIFSEANTTGGAIYVDLFGGNLGISAINLGDTDDEDAGYLLYNHNGDSFSLGVNGTTALSVSSTHVATFTGDLDVDGGQLSIYDGTANSFTIQAEGAIGGDYTVSIPTEIAGADFFCLENAGNCSGTAASLQSAYNQGNTITTTDARDIDITLANTATDSDFTIDIASGSSSQFIIQNAGTDFLSVDSTSLTLAQGSSYINAFDYGGGGGDDISLEIRSSSTAALAVNGSAGRWVLNVDTVYDSESITLNGTTVIQNYVDSTTGFQVNDADGGNPILNVDTTNERIGIGTSAPDQKLTVYGGGTTGLSGYTSGTIASFQNSGGANDDVLIALVAGNTQGLAGFTFGDEANPDAHILAYDNNDDALKYFVDGNVNPIWQTTNDNFVITGGAAVAGDTSTNLQVSSTNITWATDSSGSLLARFGRSNGPTDNAGINLQSGNQGDVFIALGDTDDYDAGLINYDNNTNTLSFVTNTATALSIGSTQIATFSNDVAVNGGQLGIYDGVANTFTIQAEGAIGGDYTISIPTEISGADFFCLEVAANCAGGDVSSSLTDNIADALDIQEGTNNYININTTDSSENISFGNATTNPSFNFLGGGTLDVAGKVTTLSDDITFDTASSFENALTVGSGATITVDNTGAYRGIVFNPTIEYVDPFFFTGGRSFEESATLKNPNATAKTLPHQTGFYANAKIQGDGALFTTSRSGFLDNTQYEVINSGTVTASTHYSFESDLDAIGSGVTITDLRGLYVDNAAGAGSVTTQYGAYINALTKGTNNYGIVIGEATGTNQANLVLGATTVSGAYSLYSASTDASYFAGALTVDGAAVFNEQSNDVDFRIESNNDVDVFFVEGSSDRVGIGDGTPDAKLDIQGDADEIQLQVQANGTQTANIVEIEDGSGNNLIVFDAIGGAIFNENGNDADFRIEGDTDANLLFVDAGTDSVGIGNNAPVYKLDVLDVVTAQTTDGRVMNVSNAGSTFDTTSGDIDSIAGYFSNTATESAGSNALTNYGVYATATHSGGGNSSVGVYGSGTAYGIQGVGLVGLSGNGGWVGVSGDGSVTGGSFTSQAIALQASLTTTTTTGESDRALVVTVNDTGIVTTGTDTTLGIDLDVTRTGATGGTINTTGIDLVVTGDTGGTSTVRGLSVAVSGADTNYAATFTGGNVGIGLTAPTTALNVETGSAGYLLRVKNTTSSGEYAEFVNDTNAQQISLYNSGNGGGLQVLDNSSNTIIQLQAVQNDGEILRLIQPSASAYNAVAILSGGDADDAKIELKEDNGQYGFDILYDGGLNQFQIWADASTDGNENLVLVADRATQDVGIGGGVTSPDAILELGGNRTKANWGANGIVLQSTGGTYTDSTAGASTLATFNSFAAPTLAASSAKTTTTAATVYIAGAPVAGTNQTITDSYSLYVGADDVKIEDRLEVGNNASLFYGQEAMIAVQQSHSSNSRLIGIKSNIFQTTGSNTNSVIGVFGDGTSFNIGAGNTLANAIGILGASGNAGGANAGTVTNAIALYAQNSQKAGGTVTNGFGLLIEAQTNGTNNSGIVVGESTGTNQSNLVLGQTTIPSGSFSIYNSSTDDNYFAGDLGIGDVSPDAKLDVEASAATVAIFNRTTDDGTIIDLQQDGVSEGSISVSGNTISYNAFTGSHYATIDEPLGTGALVRFTGNNEYLNDNPLSETLYGIEATAEANDPKAWGSFLALEQPLLPHDNTNPYLVMAVGNGEMWVAQNQAGDIEEGDYLISSDLSGHAMKDPRTDAISYIVAKASESVDWSTITQEIDGRKVAKVTVFFEAFARDNANIGLTTAGIDIQGDAVVGEDLLVSGNITASQGINVLGLVSTQDLVVTGSASIGTLSVTGNATFAGDLTVEGTLIAHDLVVNGKLISAGDTPEIDLGAVLGVQDTVEIEGNDTAGSIKVTLTNTSPALKGELARVDFDEAYEQAPRISLTARNANAATLQTYVVVDENGFSIFTANNPSIDKAYRFDYIIIQ